MPFSASAVANLLIDLAERKGVKLDHMKLQKLVYYAHGWYHAIHDKPLLDEYVEAWPYGPVVSSLYHQFKVCGSGPIRGHAIEVDPQTNKAYEPHLDDEEAREVVARVWDEYGKFDALTLSDMTHRPHSPWSRARSKHGNVRNAPIENAIIHEHFKQLARNNRGQNAAEPR